MQSNASSFQGVLAMADKDKKVGKAAGGYARAEALAPKQREEIARNAALVRWSPRLPVATHEGTLKIGDLELPVAVLEGGIRVLTSGAILAAFKRPWRGSYKRTGLPNFVDAKKLKPFITEELLRVLEPIDFRGTRRRFRGYRAEALPLVCDVFLRAREATDAITLSAEQQVIAKQAEILVRALSKVGIVALVDEVTGYQEVRPRDALQQYLEMLVRKELAAWAKKFPDEFYENIYTLKGWHWPGMSKNRYSVVAHYTRDLVYERMAPDLLRTLEEKSPMNEKGHRKNRLHQWLTQDIGDPMLAQHIHSLIMFQRLAISSGYGWKRFVNMVDQVLPKKDATMLLPFIDPEASTEPSPPSSR
jgi:hypothetical protein